MCHSKINKKWPNCDTFLTTGSYVKRTHTKIMSKSRYNDIFRFQTEWLHIYLYLDLSAIQNIKTILKFFYKVVDHSLLAADSRIYD